MYMILSLANTEVWGVVGWSAEYILNRMGEVDLKNKIIQLGTIEETFLQIRIIFIKILDTIK